MPWRPRAAAGRWLSDLRTVLAFLPEHRGVPRAAHRLRLARAGAGQARPGRHAPPRRHGRATLRRDRHPARRGHHLWCTPAGSAPPSPTSARRGCRPTPRRSAPPWWRSPSRCRRSGSSQAPPCCSRRRLPASRPMPAWSPSRGGAPPSFAPRGRSCCRRCFGLAIRSVVRLWLRRQLAHLDGQPVAAGPPSTSTIR